VLLNRVLQQRWIGRAAKGDNHLLPWPPCSPDLTQCDFCLWGFVKYSVYVPPLPMSLNELRDRITHALQTITADMLHRVWYEFQGHGQWWYVNAVFNEPPKKEIAWFLIRRTGWPREKVVVSFCSTSDPALLKNTIEKHW